jgi:hypothetical protein
MTVDPAIERLLLKLLFKRSQQFADAVRMGQLGFLDAVYLIADAARDSGLADGISDARLQRCIGTAFMGALPKTSPSTTTTTTTTLTAPERGAQT